jgi:hypothetical protein
MLMLLNTCRTHQCTNGFMDELFPLLRNLVFPKLNNLRKSYYERKILIHHLVGHYNKQIHVCENGCV